MGKQRAKQMNVANVISVSWFEIIMSMFVMILILFAIRGLVDFYREYKEKIRQEGYKQAEQDYAQARAFPVFYSFQNQTSNETQMITIAVPVCSEEFRNNYQQICGSGQ